MPKKTKDLKKKANNQTPHNTYSNNVSDGANTFTNLNQQEKSSLATVRTTVVMDDDIHRRLKIFLAKNRLTFREFMNRYIEACIQDIP